MGLTVNTNIAALNAYRNLSNTQTSLSKSLERLSSGLRINRAADDAAGLAISEGLQSQIGGLQQASRNAQDGNNVVGAAEGALTEVHSILQRMRDLAVQSANSGSLDASAQGDIQNEVVSLASELDRISSQTTFNNVKLLDGSFSAKNFQVGYAATDQISVTIDSGTATKGFSSTDLAVQAGLGGVDLSTGAGATAALTLIDAAIQNVSTARGTLGAAQNRFGHIINAVNVAVENLSASKSNIKDTDMAAEMVSFTRAQILSQAGTAMLAQANSIPQGVLKLLQ
jgi:flagellin